MAENLTLAKAYVQIVPSTKGISGSISSALGGEAKSAGVSTGESLGASLASTFKKVLVGLGIGKIVKDALNAGGDLQQSFGGLETIYGNAATQAKKFANEATRAGISANDYAEQAVSFGAALKQAYGGNTFKAMQAANTAILDMADNSAKMGTDIQSVQNAYQGFAKQNYTMLDNLKLGYGGTKSEMERLLADAEKLSGIEYNIENLGDVYDAIHVIQEDLGLTGVAAAEASSTFTGSFAAMKSAAQNLLANLALGENIKPALNTLGQTVYTFITGNLFPMVKNILQNIPEVFNGLSDMITSALNDVAENAEGIVQFGKEMITGISKSIFDNLPTLLKAAANLVMELGKALLNELMNTVSSFSPSLLKGGIESIESFISGMLSNIPAVINSATEVLGSLLDTILTHLPEVLEMGVDLVLNIVKGILSNLPEIIAATIKMLTTLMTTIIQHFPEILQKGIEIVGRIRAGLIQAIPDIVRGIGEVVKGMLDYWKTTRTEFFNVGGDIINGIVNGIKNAASSVLQAIKDVCSQAIQSAKNFLKIGSPSKVMSDKIGQWIPAGIASGIEGNVAAVKDAMSDLSKTALNDSIGDLNGTITRNVVMSGNYQERSDSFNIDSIGEAVFNALQGLYIYMDSRAVGQLVAEPVNNTLGKNAIRRV